MDMTGWAALITAFVGIFVGAGSLFAGYALPARIERLQKLSANTPEDSIARKSLDEAVDWLALRVVQRTRYPVPGWVRAAGYLLYLGGAFLVVSQFLTVFNDVHLEVLGEPHVILMLLGIGVMILGLVLMVAAMRHGRRRKKLKLLRQAEERDLIKAHLRLELDGDGR